MRIGAPSIAMLLALVACAGGTGGGRSDEEGDDVADDTLGSTNVTNDTIDPTEFSTTDPDETTTTNDDTTTADADTSAADTGTGATTATGDGPTVVEVTPAAGATGVDPSSTITVTFSDALDPASVTVDESSECTGAIQASADDFASCIAMAGPAVASVGDTAFELTPADPLESATAIVVRVLADATSAEGVPVQPYESREGFTIRYFHTIDVDGVDDWDAGETFSTSTIGHLALTAWDDDFVYLGMQSSDVAAGDASVWVVAYIGGAGGTSTGQAYNTQQPELPFGARWHLRWRANNTYTDVQEWDGAAWITAPWQLGMGDVYQSGELVEFRIARSDLEDPDTLELHVGILREADLAEASWAAHPQGSYTDGYDPDYTEYWAFDLLGSALPLEQAPLP